MRGPHWFTKEKKKQGEKEKISSERTTAKEASGRDFVVLFLLTFAHSPSSSDFE